MKKKILITLFTILALVIPTSSVKALLTVDGSNTGESITAAGCDTASTGWCMWNNRRFTMAKVSIIFYHSNGTTSVEGGPVIFYNGNVTSRDIEIAMANTGASAAYHKSYWPTTSGSYAAIDAIVEDLTYLPDIVDSTKAGLYAQIEENIKNKYPEETLDLGEKQGYRVLVEPIYKVKANGKNGTAAGYETLATLRDLVGMIPVDSRRAFGLYLHVNVSDVYDSVNCDNGSVYGGLQEFGGPGCGIGLYAPFGGEYKERPCKVTIEADSCGGGVIKDPPFSCIYQNDADPTMAIYFNRPAKSNRYCKVVCVDEVTYIYPNSIGVRKVLQGGFMTIGANDYENLSGSVSIGPVQVRNKRICRVTGNGSISKTSGKIDKSLFLEDRVKFERNIPIYKKDADKKITFANEVLRGSPNCVESEQCEVHKDEGQCLDEYNRLSEKEKKKYNGDSEKYVNGCVQKTCKKAYNCTFTGSNGLSISKTYEESDFSASKAKTDFDNEARKMLNDAVSTFNSEVTNYKMAIDNWIGCSTSSILDGEMVNDLKNANVALDYANVDKDGNVVYSYENAYLSSGGVNKESENTKLFAVQNSTVEKIPDQTASFGQDQVTIGDFGIYEGSGDSYNFKKWTPIRYGLNILWWERSQINSIDMTLPDNGYQYKTIPEGIYTIEQPDINNYVRIGFSVMPVSMTTPRGKTYNFSLGINSLGSRLGAKFAKLLPETETDQCAYEVDCEDYIIDPRGKMCTDIVDNYCASSNTPVPCGDIKIIYRTISLNEGEAFPGISAQGRTPGDNWNDEDYVTYTETKRYKYIYNNRGVKGYAVYNLDPMYDITLTPDIIKKYRAYNKEANRRTGLSLNKNNGENGILGYSDFESMICSVEDMGHYTCTSSLLRGINKYRSGETNSELLVKGCAIKEGKGGYSNCGNKSIVNNQAWAMNISKRS